jgi:hypothetical protein
MADAAFRQWQRRAVLFATVQTRKRAAAAAAAAEDDERQRRARKEAYIIAGLANAGFLVDDSDGKRRVVERTEGGWSNSTIQTYLLRGDAQTYHLNFRCTKKTFEYIVEKLSASGHITNNSCRNKHLRMTAAFKVAVCLYFMAGHGKGDFKAVGDAASLGKSTVELYLKQFCEGVLAVLRPIFMPSTPPSAEHVERVREAFAARRGIGAVGLTVDGTHVPFRGGPDYRNYKGWTVRAAPSPSAPASSLHHPADS